MPRRDLLALFGLALVARALVAGFQALPGYMDADYYALGAQQLAMGHGFTEPIVWNYLDAPSSLPHPSHLYWMPLPSMLAALPMAISGSSYRAAQAPFVLLAAALPPIAYLLAWRVTARRDMARIAGLLMLFSGFYLPFWGLPESFTPYAVFGSLALILASARSTRACFAAGVCAGLAHLSRADGALLLIPALLVLFQGMKDERGGMKMLFILHPSFLILGYLVVMLPWFLRNLSAIGVPLSPAGTQTLWLCHYDELFALDAAFDVNHLLGCGIDHVVATKVRALGSGLVHLAAENGLVFLAPLMAVGLWRLRHERLFRPAIIYLVLLYLAMTLAFTFVGERGGLFHSSAALMPFLCAAAPVGLEAIVETVARRRRTWDAASALRVFGIGSVLLAVFFSSAIVGGRVIASDWNRADEAYRAAGAWLAARGDAQSIVMAGNSPGFAYHTGHPSIVVPFGNADAAFAAAQRFGARWLILDANRPEPLAALYTDPDSDPRFVLSATFDGTRLFQIVSR